MDTRGPRSRRAALWSALALLTLMVLPPLVAGCGGDQSASASGADDPVELTVFAAASLTEAFTALADEFEATNPGVSVTLNLASSQTCATQIRQGAPADVFASADVPHMDDVADLVEAPQVFAHNALAIAVEPGDPLEIAGLVDLARDDLKVVLGAPEIPVGAYALRALDAQGIVVEPVSLEETVKAVVTKVELESLTPRTITDVDTLRDELQKVRECGYAEDDEESLPGLRCVGAPIWNSQKVVAALSVSGSTLVVTEERLEEIAADVVATAQRISTQLGATPS